jgi:hypothetical protein
VCDGGYRLKGNKCVKKHHRGHGGKHTPVGGGGGAGVGGGGISLLQQAGINQFRGVNSGIASWFRTNSQQDSTNGLSFSLLCVGMVLMGWASRS